MAFFSGPSKFVTLRMAQGVASSALQLHMLSQLDGAAQKDILSGMKAEGAPTSMSELIAAAGSVIIQHQMGSWKKAQFLGMIRSHLMSGGMSPADAAYLTGMIELSRGVTAPPLEKTRGQSVEPTKVKPPLRPLKEELGQSSKQRYGFKTDELIVYPAHGVGRIVAIEEQEIAGAKLELFVINFAEDKMTLRVPTANFSRVGIRKLSDPSMVRQAFGTLSERSHVASGNWSRQAEACETKINSGDIVALAEVVRDLYRPVADDGQSYRERKLFEAALDRLSREIAAIHDVPDAEAVNEIESLLASRSL